MNVVPANPPVLTTVNTFPLIASRSSATTLDAWIADVKARNGQPTLVKLYGIAVRVGRFPATSPTRAYTYELAPLRVLVSDLGSDAASALTRFAGYEVNLVETSVASTKEEIQQGLRNLPVVGGWLSGGSLFGVPGPVALVGGLLAAAVLLPMVTGARR